MGEIVEAVAVLFDFEDGAADADIVAGATGDIGGADDVAVEAEAGDDVVLTADGVVAGALAGVDKELVIDVVVIVVDDKVVVAGSTGAVMVLSAADDEVDTEVDVEVRILLVDEVSPNMQYQDRSCPTLTP